MDRFIICPFNFIENFEFYGSLRADQSNFRVAPDNGWRHSASPRTTGGDTPRRPGQRVATLGVAPDNGCLHLASPRTTGGLHSASPRTTGGLHSASPRTTLGHFIFVWLLYGKGFKNIFCVDPDNGWQTLRAAPDNGWQTLRVAPDNGCLHSASPRTTGVYTPRCPGRRALSLRADPDSVESIKLKITPHIVKKVFKKVDTDDQ